MSANEKMDAILTALSQAYKNSVGTSVINHANGGFEIIHAKEDAKWFTTQDILLSISQKGIDATKFLEIKLIVDYLVELNYIEIKNNQYKIFYAIKWSGQMFIQNDGFNALSVQNTNRKVFDLRKDVMLVVGSWAAGMGTIFLSVVEISKQYPALMISSMDFFVLLIVFLTGSLLTMCCILIWQTIKGKLQSGTRS